MTIGEALQSIFGTSRNMSLHTGSTAPQDTHLGVHISLRGWALSYDHHVCHPRNGERWREEGKSRAARTWASGKILIERSVEFVCQLPCRNNTPFLHPAISLLNAQAPAHTHSSLRSTRPPFATSTANTAKPKMACNFSLKMTQVKLSTWATKMTRT